jgi:hypothetical protein
MVSNKKKEEEGSPNTEADLAPSHFLEQTSVHPPFLEVSTRHTSRDQIQMTQATKPSLDGCKLMNT